MLRLKIALLLFTLPIIGEAQSNVHNSNLKDTIEIQTNFEKLQLIIEQDQYHSTVWVKGNEITTFFDKNTFLDNAGSAVYYGDIQLDDSTVLISNDALNHYFDSDQPVKPIQLAAYADNQLDTLAIQNAFVKWYEQQFDSIPMIELRVLNLDEDEQLECLVGITFMNEDKIEVANYYIIDVIDLFYSINGFVPFHNTMSCSKSDLTQLESGRTAFFYHSYNSSSCGGFCSRYFTTYTNRKIVSSNHHSEGFQQWLSCYNEDESLKMVYTLDEKMHSITATSYQVDCVFEKLESSQLKFKKRLKKHGMYTIQLTFILDEERGLFKCKEIVDEQIDAAYFWPYDLEYLLIHYPELLQKQAN